MSYCRICSSWFYSKNLCLTVMLYCSNSNVRMYNKKHHLRSLIRELKFKTGSYSKIFANIEERTKEFEKRKTQRKEPLTNGALNCLER